MALPFMILCVRLKWVIIAIPRPPYQLESAPAPTRILQGAEWIFGTVWTGVEERKYLAPTGYRTPNLSARSDSLSCMKVILNLLVL